MVSGVELNKIVVIVCSAAVACTPAAVTSEVPASHQSRELSSTDSSVARQAALVDSVRRTYTQVDVDFMTGMIHHHAQALVMSRMAPSHGASPALRIMAERIINAQNDEIDLMQAWLRDRGLPVPEPRQDGHKGHEDHATMLDDHEMMAGMLTDEQLIALDAARGEQFDRLFLQFMIQHHQGAVTMVSNLVAIPGAAREETVFKLASDIGADQTSEITRMQTMLRDLLFSDAP